MLRGKIIVANCKKLSVSGYLSVIGALMINNGCCKGEPVVVTGCIGTDGNTIYSAQCACGCWCTNGHKTVQDALTEWLVMSEKPYWRDRDGDRLDKTSQINS